MINPGEKPNDLVQKINELQKRLKESTEEDEQQNLKEEIKKTWIAVEQEIKDCGLALAKLAFQKEISEAEVYEKFASIKGIEETDELWRSKGWDAKRVLMSEFMEGMEEIIKLNSNLLPNAENAVVDIRKLRDYSLNRDHSTGKDKARLFSSILGMTAENAEELRQIILEKVKTQEVSLNRYDKYGQRYTLDFTLEWQNRSATIRTGWIIKSGSDIPSLTSCYPLV